MTTTEVKYSLERFNIKLNREKKRISELNDKSSEIVKLGEKKK